MLRRTPASPCGRPAPTARLIGARVLGVEAAVAAGDREARDEPLDVPLERAGKRLVEVVDAEDQAPVGRGERAEVREVRVAAELRVQARPRRPAEIGGHDRGRAAIEGERRDQHPPVADRHQLRHPRLRLLLDDGDRVAPPARRLPAGVGGARDLGARGLALGRSLGLGQMLDARYRAPRGAW